MMPSRRLTVSELTCRYGSVTALNAVSFTVEPGEFVSVLGPSGCGKSTLLRAVAGLEPIAGGSIVVDGASIEGLRPKERQVAFVFQSYALYPHMTCAKNLSLPLQMMELPTWGRIPLLRQATATNRARLKSIAARVAATAEQLQITPFLERYPSALSGGQRQRVALGRALIREPSLFLLDEPLANLDAALRNETRCELRALQKRIGATTLFVTHDQAEAMAISDRVLVMFDGEIRQIGTPDELYRAPADLTVARFLSQPHLNVIDAAALHAAIGERTREGPILLAGRPLNTIDGVIAFRPEHARLRPLNAPSLPGLKVTVDHAEHCGVDAHIYLSAQDGGRFVVRIPSAELNRWPAGTQAVLQFELDAVHVFPRSGPQAHAAMQAVA